MKAVERAGGRTEGGAKGFDIGVIRVEVGEHPATLDTEAEAPPARRHYGRGHDFEAHGKRFVSSAIVRSDDAPAKVLPLK